MTNFLDIAVIIISVSLIISVILQSKGAGLGGLTGADTGGVFTARRGTSNASCSGSPSCSASFSSRWY